MFPANKKRASARDISLTRPAGNVMPVGEMALAAMMITGFGLLVWLGFRDVELRQETTGLWTAHAFYALMTAAVCNTLAWALLRVARTHILLPWHGIATTLRQANSQLV